MMAPTHQTFGLTWGLGAILVAQSTHTAPSHPAIYIPYLLLVLLGSLIPDLDYPGSKLGRRLWFISYPLNWMFGHRTFTHSIFFILLLAVPSLWLSFHFGITYWYAVGFLLGVASHIAGDFLTNRGVPLFHPLSKKRLKAPITFKTGSGTEQLIMIALLLLNVACVLRFFHII